ncbi:MAG: ankyrin repeat domain-containing protein, partial [Planctomycetia bacterium]|nr:ankyrin repeat domain-containing protein [Planctomycetia bacterium]
IASGELPAHMAAWGGCLEALKYFVENCGVNIAAANTRGESLLHFAANGGSVECAKYLVNKGASLSVENTQGQTPFDYANMANQNRELIVAYFESLKKGTDLSPSQKIANTFLFGTLEECQKLVDEGVNLSLAIGGTDATTTRPDQTVTAEKSPVALIMLLIEKNETDKVRLILEHD